MPKTLYVPRIADGFTNAGIDLTWTPSAQRIDIGGWYDHCVGLPNDSMSLREFFDALGITRKNCVDAFDKPNARNQRRPPA